MKIAIWYKDGQYNYGKVAHGFRGDVIVEVPDEQVCLWEAISSLNEIMQKQLCELQIYLE